MKKTKSVLPRNSENRIIADPNKTLPALIFSVTGRAVCAVTGRKEPLPWYFSLAALAIVIQIPTLIVTYLFHENAEWSVLGFVWMGYIELGLFASAVARTGVFYLFKNLREYIVPAMRLKKDLDDLQQVMDRAWSIKGAIYFTLAFTIFWGISFSLVYTLILGRFIGFGLLVGTIVFGLLTGPALFMEGWFFFFIIHIGYYEYHLNETSPAHSEVVQRISRTITVLLYSFAVFIAFATVAVSFNPVRSDFNLGAVSLAVLIGWFPTTVYFAGSQITINRIIAAAKWKTLNRIQEEIRILNDGDITNKNRIESINRLIDYHDRIRATPDSLLGVGTSLNFVNQLALPVVGLLLANIDRIKQFLP